MSSYSFEYSEKRIIENRRRRNAELKRHIIMFAFSFVLFVGLFVFLFSLKSQASDGSEAVLFKYYKSVEVSAGDTLYDIASSNLSTGYALNELIDEISFINNIDSTDKIYAGAYIIVPYYDIYK